VGLLEVIEVDPTTVNVEFVVNDSGLVGESPTKVILWVLSGHEMDSEQEKKHSLCPHRHGNVL
jgi:predicted membrane GTPase involved in stress response